MANVVNGKAKWPDSPTVMTRPSSASSSDCSGDEIGEIWTLSSSPWPTHTHTHTHTGYNQISSSGLNFTQAIRLVSTLPVVPLKFCSWQLDGWKFFSGDSVWIEIQLLFLVGVEIFLLQELGDSLTEKEDLLRDSLLGALAGFGCGPGEEDLRFHPMFNLSLSLKRQVTLKKN